MRIENFQKLKRSDHSPKRDEFVDVSSDPPYFSLDSPFKSSCFISTNIFRAVQSAMLYQYTYLEQFRLYTLYQYTYLEHFGLLHFTEMLITRVYSYILAIFLRQLKLNYQISQLLYSLNSTQIRYTQSKYKEPGILYLLRTIICQSEYSALQVYAKHNLNSYACTLQNKEIKAQKIFMVLSHADKMATLYRYTQSTDQVTSVFKFVWIQLFYTIWIIAGNSANMCKEQRLGH